MHNVSIIIPTYNRAQLVQASIESVLKQKSSNWELIVVDDGSTDDTKEVLKKYLGDNIKYVYQENGGANLARNRGAQLAKYEYLTFLDSDDELFPNWLNEISATFLKEPDIICCGTKRKEPTGMRDGLPRNLGKIFSDQVGIFTNGASYTIKKDLFFDVGGFDIDIKAGQHTELSYRLSPLIREGKIRIINIFYPLVLINIHDGERIRTNSDSKFRGALAIYQKHKSTLKLDPKLKGDYLRIIVFNAYQKRKFLTSFNYFIKYAFHNSHLYFNKLSK